MDTIIYILLFAIATVIIYIWGLLKEQRKSKDLFDILYKKGEKAVIKAFKDKRCLSKKDIENELINLRSSLFYTRDKLVIKDPSNFAKVLIGKMLSNGII
ncbi:hypothetical protein, partial [Romboutsia sp.]|uniref:hypothetical protein n=1 Tax=Romboutsia sp. TaxID=1965302 RepID=UPI002BC4937B